MKSVSVLTLVTPTISRTASVVNSTATIASMMFVTVIAEEYEMNILSFDILAILSPRCLSYRLQN